MLPGSQDPWSYFLGGVTDWGFLYEATSQTSVHDLNQPLRILLYDCHTVFFFLLSHLAAPRTGIFLVIVSIKPPGGRTDHIINVTEKVHDPALIKKSI